MYLPVLVDELEGLRTRLLDSNAAMKAELAALKSELAAADSRLEDSARKHNYTVDDMRREYRNELENARSDSQRNADRLAKQHEDDLRDLKRRLEQELEEERGRRMRESQEISTLGALEKQKTELQMSTLERELKGAREDVQAVENALERERLLNKELQNKIAEAATNTLSLESTLRAAKAKAEFLESDNKTQTQAFVDLEQRMQDAIESAKEANEKLRAEETLRRKLHNQVQELKGNIRVFCRVRPTLEDEAADSARINYPDVEADSKEVEVMGPEEKSSLGKTTTKVNGFSFDRVFGPQSMNKDVFDEISQLVQSALDGYNVCIFCYGQTGSGKTHTMSSVDGMIPRATRQIYDTAKSLEEKGWTYSMEGSFVEVYNENLNDLLGKADELDKKKHEIRHDVAKGKTTITDVTTVALDSPTRVEDILKRAASNRSVAATKANERSSRSHSVFILKLIGENSITGEKSEGTLNLVDLAGSERLSHSGATGERLKETQNINRSLSCLGDVIGALGQGKEGGHVPYRNSKVRMRTSIASQKKADHLLL